MRAKFSLIFALLATTALTASITEQSLKALSDASTTVKPASQDLPKGAIKADFGYYGYSICKPELTDKTFKSITMKPSTKPKADTDFFIYIDTFAYRPVTVPGLEIALRIGVIQLGDRIIDFEEPVEIPAGVEHKITIPLRKFPFGAGRFDGTINVLDVKGSDVGCLDFYIVLG